MDRQEYEYAGRQWATSATVGGASSFFHSTFGSRESEDQTIFDEHVQTRRMHFATFLSFWLDKPISPGLKEQLDRCLNASRKSLDEYREIVKDVNYPIAVVEIPIIATLENTKVVLFQDGKSGANIIEPNAEFLENYPLSNGNELREAVIYEKDGEYWRLKSSSPEGVSHLSPKANEVTSADTKPPAFDKYKKFPPSMGGLFYQINLTTIVMLNALKSMENWRLSVDNYDAGHFDDVVLELLPSARAVMIQAKLVKLRKISYNNLFLPKGPYSSFNLARFFLSYIDTKSKFNIENLIICTNTTLDSKLQSYPFWDKTTLSEGHILYYHDSSSYCYTLNENVIPYLKKALKERNYDKSVTDEDMQYFLQKLQIIVSYPPRGSLEQVIERMLPQMEFCERFDGKEYSRYINKELIDWYDDHRGTYMTKTLAHSYFCEFRSRKVCEKLENLRISYKTVSLTFGANKRILHIVPQNEHTLSLIRVYQYLKTNVDGILYFSTGDSEFLQRQMVEVFQLKKYSHLVVCLKTRNNHGARDTSSKIFAILSTMPDKKVILIGKQDDLLIASLRDHSADIYEVVMENLKFTDFTEESQEKLLERVILFYEATL